jgi:hypothetical protein
MSPFSFEAGLWIGAPLPAGWAQTRDDYFEFQLEGPGQSRINLGSTSNLAGGCDRAIDEAEDGLADATKADRTIGSLESDPRLVVSEPISVTLGEPWPWTGIMVDIALDPDWTGTCPWSDGQPAALLLIRPSGPRIPMLRITGAEHVRLILVGALSVAIPAPDAESFPAVLRAAMPVVETFSFGHQTH